MFKYQGAHCPYCDQELNASDNIAICPECGAPYHRECAQKSGSCILTELHQKGEQWQPPRPQNDETKFDGNASRRCSRCGTLNTANQLFCEVCGNDLNHEHTPGENGNASQQMPPYFIPYNPYTTPFGGVGPDEEIDGLPVRDLALYVRENTPYFIPRLKSVAQTGKGGWNWAAFFFNFYYFIYRKMWGVAILSIIVSVVLSIPSIIYTVQAMPAMMAGTEPVISNTLFTATQLSSMLLWVAKGLFAGFSNRLYARRTLKRVHKLKAEHGASPDYSTILVQKGGTSKIGLTLCLVLPFLLSFAASVIYTLIQIF